MLARGAKVMLATAGVIAVLGTGIAVAADPPTCPYGNTPQAGQTQNPGTQAQQRLRKRDGTGPYHVQRSQQRDRQGAGRGPGHRGADCPYRS